MLFFFSTAAFLLLLTQVQAAASPESDVNAEFKLQKLPYSQTNLRYKSSKEINEDSFTKLKMEITNSLNEPENMINFNECKLYQYSDDGKFDECAESVEDCGMVSQIVKKDENSKTVVKQYYMWMMPSDLNEGELKPTLIAKCSQSIATVYSANRIKSSRGPSNLVLEDQTKAKFGLFEYLSKQSLPEAKFKKVPGLVVRLISSQIDKSGSEFSVIVDGKECFDAEIEKSSKKVKKCGVTGVVLRGVPESNNEFFVTYKRKLLAHAFIFNSTECIVKVFTESDKVSD